MTKSSNEKGYTMLEVLMYTGLIIILTGVIANMVSSVFYRYKIGRINQQVIDLKKSIVYYTATWENYGDLYIGDGSMDDTPHFLSLKRMQRDNVLSMDLKNGIHALGGGFDLGSSINYIGDGVSADQDSTNNKYMFYVKFDGLSPEACTEVVTQGPFYSDSSDLDTLIINDEYLWKYEYSHFDYNGISPQNEIKLEYTGEVEAGTTKKIIPSIALSIADAVKACHKKKDNTITWIFS
jgi:hypothetical protein